MSSAAAPPARTPASERDPLLGAADASVAEAPPPALIRDADRRSRSPRAHAADTGPLELERRTRIWILAGLWTTTLLSAMNSTLVATLASSVTSDMGRSNQAGWLGTSYLLSTCVFTPLYGRLCSAFGRRPAAQTAVFFLTLGTLLSGLSVNLETLVLARFLCGIGGGGIFTTSSIVTSDMYSLRNRSIPQGLSNLFAGLGLGLGGPIGGFISDRFGWRWAFLGQLPLFFIAALIVTLNLRYHTPGKGRSTVATLKRIDYGGSLLLLASISSLLVFLSAKYNSDLPWRSPSVIAPAVLAVLLFVAFVAVELFVAKEPVLAPYLLKQKVPVLVGLNNFLVALVSFSILFFYPMWFETVLFTSAAVAGLHLLPHSIALSTGSIFAGWYLHKTGKYKMLNVVCGVLPTMAAVLLCRLTVASSWIEQWLSIVPLGFGGAVVVQTTLIALLAHLDHASMPVGTGFVQLFRSIGQVAGVAVSSALFQALLERELYARLNDPELVRQIRHAFKLVPTLPPWQQRAAQDAFANAIRAVFVGAAVCTFLAFLVRLPIPERSLEAHAAQEPERTSTDASNGHNDDTEPRR